MVIEHHAIGQEHEQQKRFFAITPRAGTVNGPHLDRLRRRNLREEGAKHTSGQLPPNSPEFGGLTASYRV